MSVKIKAEPLEAFLKTRARIAKRMDSNVVVTAANWGLFPKGAAMKNDQLVKVNPRRRCTTRIRPAFDAEKIR